MLSPEHRATIEKLSDAELEFELARGPASRFQREKFDYLEVESEKRKQAKAAADQTDQLQVAREGVRATERGTFRATVGWIVGAVIAVAAIAAGVIYSK